MGLDMYLEAKLGVYPSLYEGHNELQADIRRLLEMSSIDGGALPAESDYPGIGQVKGVTLRAAYWRKANAIHGWFVEKAQDGTDDCREYSVDRDQLQELRDLCQSILDMPEGQARDLHASTVLPPQEGFFFGDATISKWYYGDLRDTVRMLDEALKLPDSWDFTYQSSW